MSRSIFTPTVIDGPRIRWPVPNPADLPAIAAEQAARTGWAKVVIDWRPDDDVMPVEVLREAVTRVHAVGGRLAVHSQHAAGAWSRWAPEAAPPAAGDGVWQAGAVRRSVWMAS